ncbi:AzlD domain-containing protein [Bordetella bronchiseptica]
MTGESIGFWAAVAAMAVITYLTRALPFMLSTRSRLLRRLSEEGSALAALGPSLLAGIAAAVILGLAGYGLLLALGL